VTMAAAEPRDPQRHADEPQRSADEFVRRRRGRNYALLAVLVALVALFYAITIVQRAGLQ
jgi:ferric-dicitrate binding protein FerR (iron transport regulator)